MARHYEYLGYLEVSIWIYAWVAAKVYDVQFFSCLVFGSLLFSHQINEFIGWHLLLAYMN